MNFILNIIATDRLIFQGTSWGSSTCKYTKAYMNFSDSEHSFRDTAVVKSLGCKYISCTTELLKLLCLQTVCTLRALNDLQTLTYKIRRGRSSLSSKLLYHSWAVLDDLLKLHSRAPRATCSPAVEYFYSIWFFEWRRMKPVASSSFT